VYTIKTYDTQGQLLCWFTTNNRVEAEGYANSNIKGTYHVTTKQ